MLHLNFLYLNNYNLINILKLVLYAYKLIPSGVAVIVVIVPWTELSELKFTVDILINIRYLL